MNILYTQLNIFDIPMTKGGREAVCVTTNGVVKKDGHAVMGKGIAKEADDRYACSKRLGDMLNAYGNHVYALKIVAEGFHLVSFPTKYDWRDDSDINLIIQSAKELVSLCNQIGIKRCYLPKPGCANGRLNWEKQVFPAIVNILDDRFTVVIRDWGI